MGFFHLNDGTRAKDQERESAEFSIVAFPDRDTNPDYFAAISEQLPNEYLLEMVRADKQRDIASVLRTLSDSQGANLYVVGSPNPGFFEEKPKVHRDSEREENLSEVGVLSSGALYHQLTNDPKIDPAVLNIWTTGLFNRNDIPERTPLWRIGGTFGVGKIIKDRFPDARVIFASTLLANEFFEYAKYFGFKPKNGAGKNKTMTSVSLSTVPETPSAKWQYLYAPNLTPAHFAQAIESM